MLKLITRHEWETEGQTLTVDVCGEDLDDADEQIVRIIAFDSLTGGAWTPADALMQALDHALNRGVFEVGVHYAMGMLTLTFRRWNGVGG